MVTITQMTYRKAIEILYDVERGKAISLTLSLEYAGNIHDVHNAIRMGIHALEDREKNRVASLAFLKRHIPPPAGQA